MWNPLHCGTDACPGSPAVDGAAQAQQRCVFSDCVCVWCRAHSSFFPRQGSRLCACCLRLGLFSPSCTLRSVPPQGHKYLRVVIADRRNFSLFWFPSNSHAWEPSLGFTLSTTFFSFCPFVSKPSHRAFTGGGGNYSPFCFTITLLIHVGWRVTKTSWGE